MVVDDLVVCGAEPLFLTDYIASGRVVPERIAAIVAGHRRGLRRRPAAPWSAARPPSTPGCSAPDEYDVAGAGHRRRRGRPSCSAPDRVRPATSSSRWRSSGLHSNGYSLVRHVLLDRGRAGRWTAHVDELGRTLGEELLEPTRIYAKACLDLARGTGDARDVATSPAAGSPPTWPGCCPATWSADVDRAHLDAAAGLRPGRPGGRGRRRPTSSARSTAASAWSPLVAPDAVDRAARAARRARRADAWVVRRGAHAPEPGERGDADAKGGGGGAVSLVGTYARP